ncbi:hypothetical protein ES288_D01G254600v1 [Gossypium darwinii]|uniref:Protein kinase domain-containing protein n=1 Tax=Gossypium darwinii TaxID=34276 RepID=A0A5D2DU07_GOSDA|nr:hypothetical protein ES288_D01G254600v1 [Gossypium darwinii]
MIIPFHIIEMHPRVLRSFSLLLCVAIQVFVASQTANISLGSSTVASEDSPPWYSPSKEFAFRFRRINNQNLFLLAIWFDTIPDKTIVCYDIGRFQLRLLTDGNLALNPVALPTKTAYSAYYVSGTNDAANESNSGFRLVLDELGYLNVIRRNGNIENLTTGSIPLPKDFFYRATLDVDGIFTRYAHPKFPTNGINWVKFWTHLWSKPNEICTDFSNDLGGGICGLICYCLLGFSLSDPDDKFSGCKQDYAQTCDPNAPNPKELYEKKTLKFLVWRTSAIYEALIPSNKDDCRDACISDCNCVITITYSGSCWKKKLPLTSEWEDISTYGTVFIKIPKANRPLLKRIKQLQSILSGNSVFLNFLLKAASLIPFFCWYHKRPKHTAVSSILETNLQCFGFEYLKKATEGFREELGRGAFGPYTKGSTTLIAKEFVAEASAIAKTHHRYLVRLVSFCNEGRHRLLVYEFVSNGTLAIQIAFGIARGLAYLHEECGTQIIHYDIKPQNILLDDSFTARISDFRLAKILMIEQAKTLTAIRGTRGYVSPEWFKNMPITEKVYVYSFGVMLLDIIFCRKSLETERENEDEIILLVENEEEAKLDIRRTKRLVMVGIWCIQKDLSLRRSMKIVTQMLEGVVQVSVPPCPSPFAFSSV